MSNYPSTRISSDNEMLGSNLLTGAAIFVTWLVLMAMTAGPAPAATGPSQAAAGTSVQETVVVTAPHLGNMS